MSDMKCIDPDSSFPFYAYRRLSDEARPQDIAPSLAHFFESEKLRGYEDIRLEVLNAPTPRMARKIAKRYSVRWREDWMQMRARVFAAGLAMQMTQSKEVVQLARETAEDALSLSSVRVRLGGLPISFISNVTATLLNTSIQKSAVRVGFLTLRHYVPQDMEERLDAIFAQRYPLFANIYAGEEANTVAERWCMRRAVPLRFVGSPASRLRERDHNILVRRMTSFVVCAPDSRKEVRGLLAAAKKAKAKVIDLTRHMEPEEQAPALLSG